ncbi:MAG: ArsA-related P-loop ATPase [Mycobacteriales bacterium]
MPSKTAARRPDRDWPRARLHIVTGKGGAGKTTLAGALAIALAADGRRTLLVEVEGRQGIAQLFDTPPLPYAERRIAAAPGGGEVRALAVDVEAALIEYLGLFYNLTRAGRALRRMGAIDFATTIAPGLRDVLLTGKVKEAVTRVADGHRVYDAVVLDGPPTGRIARFLSVNDAVGDLARVGPIKTQSDGVMAVLRSSQTAIHLVTLLEEMPVQETIDAVDQLCAAGLRASSVLVNLTRPPLLPARELARAASGRLDVGRLATALGKAGLQNPELASMLAAEAHEHAVRCALEEGYRTEITKLALPTLELATLPPPMDLGGLYELADELRASGVRTA